MFYVDSNYYGQPTETTRTEPSYRKDIFRETLLFIQFKSKSIHIDHYHGSICNFHPVSFYDYYYYGVVLVVGDDDDGEIGSVYPLTKDYGFNCVLFS